jgi:hypothetical protein
MARQKGYQPLPLLGIVNDFERRSLRGRKGDISRRTRVAAINEFAPWHFAINRPKPTGLSRPQIAKPLISRIRPTENGRVGGSISPLGTISLKCTPASILRMSRWPFSQVAPGAHHSITSSARARIAGGMTRPSAFAVVTLTKSSTFVGWMTGKFAGLSPLRMRPI